MSKEHMDSLYKTLSNLVEVIRLHGIVNVVLSPGSRSAPLALSFIRNGRFDIYQIVDERSAGYFGLGLSKASGRPTVLVCTSGTAAYNYAPAVAEAHFQGIPMLVLTADRPPEWIGQNDNQAIYQQQLYGAHVAASIQMPASFMSKVDADFALQKMNEACLLSQSDLKGPVHVNFPFREPFYSDQKFAPDANLRVIRVAEPHKTVSPTLLKDMGKALASSSSVWMVAGMTQKVPDPQLINQFVKKVGATPFIDPLSNLHIYRQVHQYDAWLKAGEATPPDFVISFGNHFLSKHLKSFLRTHPPKNHIHIQNGTKLADPFRSVNFLLDADVDGFFRSLNQILPEADAQTQTDASLEDVEIAAGLDAELQMAGTLIGSLPDGCVLHLGNSTPVRYLLTWSHLIDNKGIMVYANRGTSGIDGSVSTAIGMAQNDDRPHVLIIGDLSLYYDRNGLWNNYVPENFKLVVVNNSGGGIFRRIEGPKKQPELESYFVSRQHTDFEALAKAHHFRYHAGQSSTYKEFFESAGKALLEIQV